MIKKILLSNLTRCFLVGFIYTIIIISIYYSNNPNTMMLALIIFYPSPFYFALYGIVRQLIYENQHRMFISTLILAGTIFIIYGLYYVIDEVNNFGINKIYWSGFISYPAYILHHTTNPALGFFIGCVIAKVFQIILGKLEEIARNNHIYKNK